MSGLYRGTLQLNATVEGRMVPSSKCECGTPQRFHHGDPDNTQKKPFVYLCVLCAFVVSLVVARVALAGQADTVVRKGNKQVFGEVIKDSYEGVIIKINRGRIERKIKASDVETIYYGDQPRAFRDGKRLLESGQYSAAAARFREALKVKARPWLKVYGAFYLAESLALNRRFTEAADAYRQCVAADGKSRFVFDAQLGIGLCQFAMQQYGGAAATLSALSRDAPDERHQLIAQLSMANLLLVQDRTDEARRIYQELKSKAKQDALMSGTSELGVALIAAKLKAPGAEASLHKALAGPSANVLKFLAWALLAQRASDAKQYDAAMTGYLRADFYLSRAGAGDTFTGAPFDVAAAPGDRGELLFRAAGCAEVLKKADEAIALYEAVRTAQRQGEWATKAAQRLKALQ